jgi:hypothetical protein
MVGCPGAQINLSVKSAIRLPPNDCVQRDIAELHSKTWELGQKGCRGAKSGWKAYQVVAVLHPMEPGSTAGDLVVRYLGTQSELRQRIGALAMKKGQPKLVVVGRRFTMGLHNGA